MNTTKPHRLRPLLFMLCTLLAASSGVRADPVAVGPPPGITIDSSSSPADTFIGSPSIVILPNGDYLASHDWFGAGAPNPGTTDIFRSTDRGTTWSQISTVTYIHFATLFYHNNAVYLLGTTINVGPGYISCRRSTDNGVTWTTVSGPSTGQLFTATTGAFSCAPTPVLVANGRVWKSFCEKLSFTPPGQTDQRALMISAPVNSDLLNAANWTRTNGVWFDPAWLNGERPGWQEGNAVQAPDGSVVNILRMDPWIGSEPNCLLVGGAAGIPRYELAAMVETVNETTSAFLPNDPDSWLSLPGGISKFTIRYDAVSGKYWTIANKITNTSNYCTTTFSQSPEMQRNVYVLLSSTNFQTWTEHCKVLRWNEGALSVQTDKTGFQYADWQFDGDDIVYVNRLGWNANRFHDANHLTFHRLPNFRSLTSANAPQDLTARTIPVAPSGVAATGGNGQVSLSWNLNLNADKFSVKRATVSGGPYSTVATVTTTSYINTGLANGTTYYYVISAVNGAGTSANSAQVSATPSSGAPPPAAPTGLVANAVSSSQINLSWTASTGAASYNVKRETISGGPYSTVATAITATNFSDTSLTNGTTYYYVVTAVNDGGESNNSNEASATTTATSPTFVAAGAISSGSGAITPALPSGIATGDVLLLFVETANQAVSISNPNSGTWAEVTGSPQGTGTAGDTSATRLTVFWSRYNGTQGAPTVSDSGNHQVARMIALRGAAAAGNPWDVTAGGIETTSDTSASISGATTTVANTLVVIAVAGGLPDANGTANFSGWSNPNLVNVTERTDDTRNSGNGGALGIATGEKAIAGAYGNTAVTHASSAAKAMISIAIKK